MSCIIALKDHDYWLFVWALIIVYNLYDNITMQQVTNSLPIRNAKINLKVGP